MQNTHDLLVGTLSIGIPSFIFKKFPKVFKFLLKLEKQYVKASQINGFLPTEDTKQSLPV